jgi:uncharacterized lipoprotein YehR (DUF1307 family)
MKKKFLSVLAIAVILFGAMFMLAGCGDKDNSKKENDSNKNNAVAVG